MRKKMFVAYVEVVYYPSNGYRGVVSPRVKRQGREGDHSPPSKVKNGGAIPPFPNTTGTTLPSYKELVAQLKSSSSCCKFLIL
jgi:hypothetical protein